MSCETKSLEELFPFEYASVGYFRMKGVPRKVNAELLHGMQAIEYLYERMKEEASDGGQ